jgi:hypothetical protein
VFKLKAGKISFVEQGNMVIKTTGNRQNPVNFMKKIFDFKPDKTGRHRPAKIRHFRREIDDFSPNRFKSSTLNRLKRNRFCILASFNEYECHRYRVFFSIFGRFQWVS